MSDDDVMPEWAKGIRNAATKDIRNEAIEECARVADGFGDKYYFMSAVDIAAAIRALKEKP